MAYDTAMFIIIFESSEGQVKSQPFKSWYEAEAIKQQLILANKTHPQLKGQFKNIRLEIDNSLIPIDEFIGELND